VITILAIVRQSCLWMLDLVASKPVAQLLFLGQLASSAVVLVAASLSTQAQELEPGA
jgi:hypothetical protein